MHTNTCNQWPAMLTDFSMAEEHQLALRIRRHLVWYAPLKCCHQLGHSVVTWLELQAGSDARQGMATIMSVQTGLRHHIALAAWHACNRQSAMHGIQMSPNACQ